MASLQRFLFYSFYYESTDDFTRLPERLWTRETINTSNLKIRNHVSDETFAYHCRPGDAFPLAFDIALLPTRSMQNLPPELLRRIFHSYLTLPATVQNVTRPLVRHSFSSFSNPVTLTHVCHFWRAVACQDPFLWTSILIIGPSNKMLPLVDLWLQRAAHFELSLQFVERIFNRKPEELTAISNELFKILWRRRHSWAHVDFQFADIYDHSRVGDVEALLVDPPPPEDQMRVRTARIIDNRSGELNLTVPLWLNVANNPHLQSLEVGPWCLDIPPHQNLRELIFTQPLDPSYALHFLDYCPRLERFVVKIRETPGAEALLLPEGSVVRDQLRHLEINAVGQISAVPIISALTCPRLEFFSAELNGGYIESLRSLISFLCRSDCRLHTLKGLNLRYLNPETLPHFLTLPQLRNLENLLVCNADDNFCEILTQPATHRCSDKSKPLPILPNLKNLDLIEIWFSPHTFSDMLMSRFNSLQRVQILSNRTIQSLLAYDRLWDFPGTISRVDHVKEVFLELDSFGRNQMSWDPQSLFTAPERNPPLPLPGQDKYPGGVHNQFGRRLVWDTINYLEKVGQGCY